MTDAQVWKVSSITAALLFFIFLGVIFLSGGTFGQRCAKAYPDNGYEQERCVARLSKGGFVYPDPPVAEK